MSISVLPPSGYNQLANEFAARCLSNGDIVRTIKKFLNIPDNAPYETVLVNAEIVITQLFHANVWSYNAKYTDEKASFETLTFAEGIQEWNDLQLYKHLSCVLYQLEHAPQEYQQLKARLIKLVTDLGLHLLDITKEYRDLEWGWK